MFCCTRATHPQGNVQPTPVSKLKGQCRILGSARTPEEKQKTCNAPSAPPTTFLLLLYSPIHKTAFETHLVPLFRVCAHACGATGNFIYKSVWTCIVRACGIVVLRMYYVNTGHGVARKHSVGIQHEPACSLLFAVLVVRLSLQGLTSTASSGPAPRRRCR